MWLVKSFACGVLLATLGSGAPAFSQTINIGLAAPLSGPLAPVGDQVRRGAAAAIDGINEKGGIAGRKLALIVADDGCEPSRAAMAAHRLTQAEKTVAVIGHVCAPAAYAAASVYAQMRVPMMTLAPADQRLVEAIAKNGWRNIFLMAGSLQTQGFAAGTYLARRYDGNGIALIYDQSAYGAGLTDGFKQALKDRGISPKFEMPLVGNTVDVVPTVDQLRAVKPTAVYLAMIPANAAAVVKRAKEAGLDTTFVSGNATNRREFLDIAGRASEGVVSTALPEVLPSPAATEAIARLRRAGFGGDGNSLYAYAAVQVIAQAIERTGATEFNSIEPVLRHQSFSTVIGNVRFDESGNREVSEIAFSQWRDGATASFDTKDFWNTAHDAISTTRPRPGDAAATVTVRPVLIDQDTDASPIAAKALQGVFWDTYLTNGNDSDARLNAGSMSSYTLVLDLSAYNYRQIKETNAAGTAVDPHVKSALEKAPQDPVELKVRPVVLTTSLVSMEDASVQSFRVDRKKLARPQEGEAATEENRLVGRFKTDVIKLSDFSAAVAAGQAKFQIKAADNGPGCAVIAFTIWDFHDNPIDTLLQTVPVDDGSTKANCERVSPEALKGGFATLMNPVFSIGAADPQDHIQAALHLFQVKTAGQKRTVAIFVDKTQQPPPGQPASDQGVYGWQTSQWLGDYISDANGLPTKIGLARDAADSGTESPYANVADELADQIFGAIGADRPKADAARAALRRLAASQDRPVVIVRMVDENNRKLYVPFNLISASGNTKGLPRPITVVQPLQTERYEAPSCIRSWSFGLSKDTNLLDENLKPEIDALAASRPATGETWIRNAEELKAYFNATPAPTASATVVPGEGLLLLAHHDQYGIFFDNPNGRIVAQGLRHTYPPGSIAILAACGTAKPNTGMDILDVLNDDGVDAMIVSPFDVRLDYGSRMALEFAKVVRENRVNGRTPTFAEMFSQATAATIQFLKNPDNQNSNAKLEDMNLEFILAGNPNLRLCSP